jgi:small subunit ribosomal protein S1
MYSLMSPPDDEEDFAALLSQYEREHPDAARRKQPRVGETLHCRVVSIGKDAAFVDLGAKSEGMIDLGELRDADGKLTVAVGDELDATVVETEGEAGCVVLRRRLGRGPEARAELEQAHAHGIPVEGLVSAVVKGGLEVQVAGVRAFCPISQVEVRFVEDASPYVGQRLTFRITRYEPRGPNVILSRRAILEEETRARAAETRARLGVGAVVEGTVSSLKDYGAFVDLGGLEGLLHVSEIGFARVAHPKEVLAVGQRVSVQILKIERSSEPERPEKISLSLKSLERDPWSDAAERFPEGVRVSGRVARLESFGAFVELAPGLEGLVHASELGGDRPSKGQQVTVTVLGVDVDKRRISLSMARAGDDAEADAPRSFSEQPRFGTLGDLFKKK